MMTCLSKLKVLHSFCFPSQIRDSIRWIPIQKCDWCNCDVAACKIEYLCSLIPFIIQNTWVANTRPPKFLPKKREFRFSTKFLGIHSDLVENLPLFDEFIGAQRTKASAAVLSLGDIKGIFERWTIGTVFSPSWPGRGEVASNSPVKCDGAFVVDMWPSD